jgi:hypothetical protein
MAHSFLIFEFGGDEESAQQARHKIEGWKQGYRLDKKLQVKFERSDAEKSEEEETAKPAKAPKKGKSSTKSAAKKPSAARTSDAATKTAADGDAPDDASTIRLIVRLDFSEHERLSHSRWLERIPTEEPFKDAKPIVIRPGEPQFKATSDLFDSLD